MSWVFLFCFVCKVKLTELRLDVGKRGESRMTPRFGAWTIIRTVFIITEINKKEKFGR